AFREAGDSGSGCPRLGTCAAPQPGQHGREVPASARGALADTHPKRRESSTTRPRLGSSSRATCESVGSARGPAPWGKGQIPSRSPEGLYGPRLPQRPPVEPHYQGSDRPRDLRRAPGSGTATAPLSAVWKSVRSESPAALLLDAVRMGDT